MGLSSLFNPDILIGMGEAHQAKQKSILDDEASRRKQGTSLFTSIFEHPDLTPEGRDEALRQISEASMAKPDNPYKFDINRVLSVRPEVGKSVAPTMKAGGQPSGVSPSTGLPLPDLSMEFPAPEAPDNYLRSGFHSREETNRMVADSHQQQLERNRTSALATKRGELELEQEFASPKASEDFTLSPGQSRFNPNGTPKASVPATPQQPSTDNSLTETELAMKAAGGDPLAVRAWELIQKAKQAGVADRGEQGTYIPLTDIGGQVIGAWNPKAGNFVPAPQSGLRRGPAPATVNTQLNEYENSVRKLDELAVAYKPEFVGPYQGRYEQSKATGVLSYLPFLKTPEGYGGFMALNADLKNTIIKLITGAQMGVQEAERILRQGPVETDKDENWKSKFTQTQENAKFLLDKIRQRYSVVPPLGAPNPAGSTGDGQWKIIDVK